MNAIDPNLAAFKARGGKLIMYHGWNDQLIHAGNSINYYNSVSKTMGAKETDDFAAPVHGARHAALRRRPWARTPSTRSARSSSGWRRAPSPRRWSRRTATNGVVDRTRPLCPYPQVAIYKGSGSIDEAANFACTAK